MAAAFGPNLTGFKLKECLKSDSVWVRFLLQNNDESAILELKKPATIKKSQVDEILPLINFTSFRNDCKVICPAEPSLVDSHKERKTLIRKENYTNYAMITAKCKFPSCKWIYNILDQKAENNRVLLRDDDAKNGFVLVVNNEGSGEDVRDLSYTAFVMRRNLKSIRDLTAAELPLLKNIQRQCTKAIAQKHQLNERNISARVDYHPIYWHLQVNFHVKLAADDYKFTLENVCKNLERKTWFYKTVMLKVECKLESLAATLPEFKDEDAHASNSRRRFPRQNNGNQRR
ncbi:M7GpppX diphosphatase [Aphelenchoides bicaudatus]|nr:M7GpppX diphosphatase [Aphelenchoides bicaudatus]